MNEDKLMSLVRQAVGGAVGMRARAGCASTHFRRREVVGNGANR